jgi:hypothetical protein
MESTGSIGGGGVFQKFMTNGGSAAATVPADTGAMLVELWLCRLFLHFH